MADKWTPYPHRPNRSSWSGSAVAKARAYWRPKVDAGGVSCSKCGKLIQPGQTWHVDHIIPREQGGLKLGLSNTHPAHAHCNTSAGGKRGAEIINAKKKQAREESKDMSNSSVRRKSERERGIRGV